MDLTQMLSALPTASPIAILLILLAYVGKSWINSDTRYKAELQRVNDAHKEELSRINSNYAVELKELRTEIRKLRDEVTALRGDIDTERQLRFAAQEEAHRAKLGIVT
jgi:TolA-binding protein